MASSKDVFEPHTFASNVFAPGAFRGIGAAVVFQDGPFAWEALDGFVPGLIAATSHAVGFEAAQTFVPGLVAGQGASLGG